jgi:DNA-binding transcriptional regulator YhcF (GntR family)
MQLRPVDTDSPTPPFEQVRAQLAALVASGELAAGARLPTVRALAGDLGLAVNTVARVYKELEADGVVVTEGRRGTFVRSGAGAGTGDAASAARAYVARCRTLGVTEADALRLVQQHWAG